MASFDENTHTGFGSSASTRISIYEEGLASIDNNINNNFVKKDGEEISDINKRLKLNRKDISKLTSKHNTLFKKLDSVDDYHTKREFDIDEHLSRTDEKLMDAIAEITTLKDNEISKLNKGIIILLYANIAEIAAIVGLYCYIFIK